MPPLPSNADAFASIMASYALGKIRSLERLSRGTTQANYLLRASAGDFIIRSYETRSTDYVRFEIDALNQLSAANFQCQQPIFNIRGQFIGRYDEKPLVVFRYIEGEHSNGERNCFQVASAVARMHRLSQPMRFVSSLSRDRYDRQTTV